MGLFRRSGAPRRVPQVARPARGTGGRVIAAVTVGLGLLILNVLAAKAAAGPGHPVVVARTALAVGTKIAPADVTTHDVNGLPHALTSPAAVIGQTVVTAVPAGMPLVAADLGTATTARTGLIHYEVGVWVPVNLTTSALAVVGDRVDVFFTSSQLGSGTPGTSAGVILLLGARVIGVATSTGAAQTTTSPSTSANSKVSAAAVPAAVELAVPRAAAARLVEAETLGTLTLVLDPWSTRVSSPPPQLPAPASSGTPATSASGTSAPPSSSASHG